MIHLDRICVRAGEFRLNDVSLSISSGACGVLMGRTGSGKTTILECILGLRRIASGRIHIGDTDVTSLNPAVRGIGYVPQDLALFSRMTVREHLAFALEIRHADQQQIADRVDELSELLGIAHLLSRRPAGLSGGEAQRVALGRALSFKPQVLCLDEPLSALDSHTRDEMCDLLDNVRRQTHVTTLHVTHNLTEATRLSDCLFRIEDGKVLRSSLNDL
jgi:molybdate/tungstate transport system ATP-binding protein